VEARTVTDVPILGVGGVLAADDAVAYARAGANLVQMGTGTFAMPSAGPRLARELARWGRRHRVATWDDLRPAGAAA